MTNQFLDTSVVIGYAGYISKEKLEGRDAIIKLCVKFVENKKGKFLACYFTINKEINSLLKRQRIISNEIKRKIDDQNYELCSSKEAKNGLYSEDINRTKKIYTFYSLNYSNKKEEFKQNLISIQSNIETRISFFIEKLVDEKVIPIKEIEPNLVNMLREIISNYSDCNVLASAIQYATQKKEEVIFVTLDKKDFAQNNIDFMKEDKRFNDYKLPIIEILSK
ncbi:MAG: hypothetical protein AABX85_03360 [Nanoarchaeota archaeon]